MEIKFSPVPLWRRLAAILYDTFLLIAVLFIAAWILLLVIGEELSQSGHPLLTAYYISISLLFFVWFWIHGGQTLGMKVWRVRVVNPDGSSIKLRQAITRFFTAILSWLPFGAGFLWSLTNKSRLCWHDQLSSSILVKVIPAKQQN